MKHKLLQLQSLVTVVLCVIMAIAFSSCSNNDDEPPIPKVEKRLKSIDELIFVYTDGKITEELYKWDVNIKHYTDIQYSQSSIEIKSSSANYTGVYTLKDGLVTKYADRYGRSEEFTYEDGRIKTWKKYTSNGLLDEDITFEWNDGVIVRQTEYHPNNTNTVFCDYNYTYDENYDYGGIIAVFQSNSLFYDNLPECLIIQGYFGKWPKYLVTSAVDATGYFEPEFYKYTLDDDGYPIRLRGDCSADFTWEIIK